jgi:RNase adaptor protein for sRNA GlmZ degradation
VKVLVQSFSFKRTGYPVDKTGKGGGFVFDCRAIDAFDYTLRNSLMAPPYWFDFTGRDLEVSVPLDKDIETQEFFRAALTMVNLDIMKCLRANIQIMTVNFGCTAGRHRSVYLAERLSAEIKSAFPQVDVELVHLEQSHWPKKS